MIVFCFVLFFYYNSCNLQSKLFLLVILLKAIITVQLYILLANGTLKINKTIWFFRYKFEINNFVTVFYQPPRLNVCLEEMTQNNFPYNSPYHFLPKTLRTVRVQIFCCSNLNVALKRKHCRTLPVITCLLVQKDVN